MFRVSSVCIAVALISGPVACALVTDLKASDYKVEQSGGTCASVGTGAGQLTSGVASCDECLAVQCCGAAASCFAGGGEAGSSDCASFETCLSGCAMSDAGSGECKSECFASYIGGLEGALTISTCATSNCASAGCTGF